PARRGGGGRASRGGGARPRGRDVGRGHDRRHPAGPGGNRGAPPVSAAVTVKSGLYRDSVALLDLARALRAMDGVEEAAALMATPANRELLTAARASRPEARAARP